MRSTASANPLLLCAGRLLKVRFVVSMLLFSLFFSACKKDSELDMDPETLDTRWMKLSIPGQLRGISAIYGNIDDTLVVASLYHLYRTTDRGLTWQRIYEGELGISGLYMYNGELCALGSFIDQAGSSTGHHPFLFSQDFGNTWKREGKYDYSVYTDIFVLRNRAAVDDSTYFEIAPNIYTVEDQLKGLLPQPDTLQLVRNDISTPVYFPFSRRVNCLYLDEQKRLYVGAEGTRFEWSTKGSSKVYPTSTDSALLYISRSPLLSW